MSAGLRVSKSPTSHGAIEIARTEITHQRRQPGATKEPARIAHRVFAAHARPIGERRSGYIEDPKSSGRSAATIITAQPALQLPMTAGFPSASGWSEITRSRKAASAALMSSIF